VVTPSWQRHVRDTTGTVDRAGYALAGTSVGIHQLRHAYATGFNSGVSIEAVRRRLATSAPRPPSCTPRSPTPRSAPRAADGAGQRADRPCAEQAQRNRVYLVTAALPTRLIPRLCVHISQGTCTVRYQSRQPMSPPDFGRAVSDLQVPVEVSELEPDVTLLIC
jgi:hypothetical protein